MKTNPSTFYQVWYWCQTAGKSKFTNGKSKTKEMAEQFGSLTVKMI